MPDVPTEFPREYHAMPDLSHRNVPRILAAVLTQVFRGGFESDRSRHMASGFVLAVDHAVETYSLAYEGLEAYVDGREEPGLVLGPIFRASSFLGDCLTSAYRAVGFHEVLRDREPEVLDEPVLAERDRETLRDLRNEVQHMDEEVENRPVCEDRPLAVVPYATGFVLAGYEIPYPRLAHWLEELAAEAHRIAQYDEPTD